MLTPPQLDIARTSVEFYHAHVTRHEVQLGDLAGQPALPASDVQLRAYFDQCAAQAERVYQQIDG